MPAAALVVHQARYSLTYGPNASSELTAQGHSYLHSVVPWAMLALGIGASMFVRRAARAARMGSSRRFTTLSAAVLWLLTASALLAVYATQEALESLSASGHPAGIAGVFGRGGWWAMPAAALVAAGVVALLRLGRAVLQFASRCARSRSPRGPSRLVVSSSVALVAATPLARAGAGRAPPSR